MLSSQWNPVIYHRSGRSGIVSCRYPFSAGKVQERQPLTAKFTAAMLREGASGLSSAYIAEKLDYYGATLQTLATQRNTYITLYSANRYFFDILPLLCKLVVSPDFPEEEFRTLKERNRQALSVDLMKVNVLASRIFSEQLFGAENPYGNRSSLPTMILLRPHIYENFIPGIIRRSSVVSCFRGA